jgi:hypothetical protein
MFLKFCKLLTNREIFSTYILTFYQFWTKMLIKIQLSICIKSLKIFFYQSGIFSSIISSKLLNCHLSPTSMSWFKIQTMIKQPRVQEKLKGRIHFVKFNSSKRLHSLNKNKLLKSHWTSQIKSVILSNV